MLKAIANPTAIATITTEIQREDFIAHCPTTLRVELRGLLTQSQPLSDPEVRIAKQTSASNHDGVGVATAWG